jgi:hypothetical protein
MALRADAARPDGLSIPQPRPRVTLDLRFRLLGMMILLLRAG